MELDRGVGANTRRSSRLIGTASSSPARLRGLHRMDTNKKGIQSNYKGRYNFVAPAHGSGELELAGVSLNSPGFLSREWGPPQTKLGRGASPTRLGVIRNWSSCGRSAVIRGRLSDEEWAFFEPFVIERGSLRGRPPRDHRRTLDAVYWIARTGAPWARRAGGTQQLELGTPTIPPLDGKRTVGPDARRFRRRRRQRRRADGRQYRDPGTPLCRRRKGGTQNQALGRSRGGFSTKIHARTNAGGLPIALILTPCEAHDSTAFTDLMAEHDADPDVMLADKGYDSDAIRDEVRAHGGTPEIPTKRNRRVQPSWLPSGSGCALSVLPIPDNPANRINRLPCAQCKAA